MTRPAVTWLRRHLWKVHLGVGLLLVGVILALPDGSLRATLYEVLPAGVPTAVVLGLLLHRPVHRSPWLFLGAAGLLWASGDLVWAWVETAGLDPTQSVVHAYYLSAYPMLGLALAMIARRRRPRGHLPSLVDAFVVTAVLGLLAWVFVFSPWWAAGGLAIDGIVALVYPLLDLVVAVQVAFLSLTGTRRPPAVVLLLAASAFVLVSDLVYNAQQFLPSVVAGSWLDAGWLCGYLLWAAAALHPSMAELDSVPTRSMAGLTQGRVAVLGVASAVIPAVALLAALLGLPSALVPVESVHLVVVLLLVLRMIDVVRALRKQSSDLEVAAGTDFVTGFGNRPWFLTRIGSAAPPPGGGQHSGVILIGLERLIEIDEMLGHEITDELLRVVARALQTVAGPEASVARVGSDTFGVVAPGRDAEGAVRLGAAILGRLHSPLPVAGLGLMVEAAVGVVALPDDAVTADAAFEHAEAALAEARGRENRLVRYEPALDEVASAAHLLAELRAAIDAGDLVVHFQPQVDVATGAIVGAEALVRWQHAERGLIPPSAFIPVAERSALIRPLALTVLDQALSQCAVWRAAGLDLSVAVNLSVRNLLHPDVVRDVKRALARHAVPAASLELEVTETIALADPVRAAEVLTELSEMGVRLSIDDYGTGYSSLAYLHTMPVSRLKIDRTFVAGLCHDSVARAIVASTIDLAGRLGVEVVAEGVEDHGTLSELVSLGCTHAQGYLLGRPVPGPEMATAALRPQLSVPLPRPR